MIIVQTETSRANMMNTSIVCFQCYRLCKLGEIRHYDSPSMYHSDLACNLWLNLHSNQTCTKYVSHLSARVHLLRVIFGMIKVFISFRFFLRFCHQATVCTVVDEFVFVENWVHLHKTEINDENWRCLKTNKQSKKKKN